jgi:hypothetical protein
MKYRPNPKLVKVSHWLRTNGPASSLEQIEAGSGVKITKELLAQGECLGLLVWVDAIGAYV